MTRNISERPEYDSLFPDHPLSRVRRVLDHLHRTITIDNSAKQTAEIRFRPESAAPPNVVEEQFGSGANGAGGGNRKDAFGTTLA